MTPAHDPTDFEIAQRHNLPLMNILDADAELNEAVPEDSAASTASRPASAVEDIESWASCVREERPYLHAVGHCDRCDSESSRSSGSSGS